MISTSCLLAMAQQGDFSDVGLGCETRIFFIIFLLYQICTVTFSVTAVRMTHIPTGIVCACQTERSQHQNREYAMRMLKSKLLEIKEREHLDKIEDIKGVQKEITWGSQIRSYVFMPYTLVKDHRTGYETGNISAVMNGDLDDFIMAYLKQNIAN